MKSVRNMILGLLVIGMVVSFSTSLFADKGHESPAFLKLLGDSAVALQAANSNLAADMSAFAKEEGDEAKGIKEPVRTKEEKTAERQAHLKLLKDAAAALLASHPELSTELTKTAAEKEKKFAEKK